MTEKIRNREQHYFYRAKIQDTGSFVIGFPSLHVDHDDEIWQKVRDYSKQHEQLELPDPYDILDLAKSIGFVSFEEFKRVRRTSFCWEQVSDSCILFEPGPIQYPSYEQPSIDERRDGHPVQGTLFQTDKN